MALVCGEWATRPEVLERAPTALVANAFDVDIVHPPGRSLPGSGVSATYPGSVDDQGAAAWPVSFQWGEPWEVGTAAFWVDQCQQDPVAQFRFAENLRDEVIACLLGGWGIPGDLGAAAFEHLRRARALSTPVCHETVRRVLSEPIWVEQRGRHVHYRFALQRATRIAAAAATLRDADVPSDPIELRDWLASNLAGVGPKTASWVVRNLQPDAPVAVVDVHVQRVGVAAGFFDPRWRLPQDYHRFERAFVAVATRGEVVTGHLDHTIWSWMASASVATRAVLCRDPQQLHPNGSADC